MQMFKELEVARDVFKHFLVQNGSGPTFVNTK
jgi:hypothetical protein